MKHSIFFMLIWTNKMRWYSLIFKFLLLLLLNLHINSAPISILVYIPQCLVWSHSSKKSRHLGPLPQFSIRQATEIRLQSWLFLKTYRTGKYKNEPSVEKVLLDKLVLVSLGWFVCQYMAYLGMIYGLGCFLLLSI